MTNVKFLTGTDTNLLKKNTDGTYVNPIVEGSLYVTAEKKSEWISNLYYDINGQRIKVGDAGGKANTDSMNQEIVKTYIKAISMEGKKYANTDGATLTYTRGEGSEVTILLPLASEDTAGTVNTGEQSFAGNKTFTGMIKFPNITTGISKGIQWNMGDNDYARIVSGATAANDGYLEIATADDANEPIHIRQYSGVFSTLKRTLTLLDASGNTSVPGNVFPQSNEIQDMGSTSSRWNSIYGKTFNASEEFKTSGGTFFANKDGKGKFVVSLGLQADPSDDYALVVGGDVSIDGTSYFNNDIILASTKQIKKDACSVSWAKGREGSIIRETFPDNFKGYHTAVSVKTTNGSWDMGEYSTDGWHNQLLISYITDATYGGTDNKTTAQMKFHPDGVFESKYIGVNVKNGTVYNFQVKGTSAFTDYIYFAAKNKKEDNIYWVDNLANVHVSKIAIESTETNHTGDSYGYRLYVGNGKDTNLTTTVGIVGSIDMLSSNSAITWLGEGTGKAQQQILSNDSVTETDPAFYFKYRKDNASNWTNILTIRGNGVLDLTDNTGQVRKHFSEATGINQAAFQVTSNDKDATVMRIGHATSITGSITTGYAIKYIGTGNAVENRLEIWADSFTSKPSFSMNNNGQIGIRNQANQKYSLYVDGDTYISTGIYFGKDITSPNAYIKLHTGAANGKIDTDDVHGHIHQLSINGVNTGYDFHVGGTAHVSAELNVDSDLTIKDGYLHIIKAGNTLKLGSENANWAHFISGKPFYFNQNIAVKGDIYPYNNHANNCGLKDHYWSGVNARWIHANRGNSNTDGGLTLKNGDSAYSIAVRTIDKAHGGLSVSSGSNTYYGMYFTLADNVKNGWLFKIGSGIIASLSGAGVFTTQMVNINGNSGQNLYVNGTAYVTDWLSIGDVNPKTDYKFYVDGHSYLTGSVGIGSFNGDYKLYVNGKSYFNGPVTINGNLTTSGDFTANGLRPLYRNAWWKSNDTSKSADSLNAGIVFAYATHKAPTVGTLVAFSCNDDTKYALQLQGSYSSENLYFRNKNGDKGTWNNWQYVIHSGNYTTVLDGRYVNTAGDTMDGELINKAQITVKRTSAGGGFYGKIGDAEYFRAYVHTVGKACSTAGTFGTAGESIFTVGNAIARSTTVNTGKDNARGRIRLYGLGAGFVDIIPGTETNTNRTLYLPNADAQFVVHTNDTAIGGTSQPVYIAASGVATALSDSVGSARRPMWMSAGKMTAITYMATTSKMYVGGVTNTTTGCYYNASVYTSGSVLYGAAWNDYAEYRQTTDKVEPGRVVIETGLGDLKLSTERLQPGANIVSDTFGFAIGETEKAKTPLAVAGRVLVYPFEDRETYEPGDAVCSGPNGTVSKMTREEIWRYPERIVGTVSEIPNYENWESGDGNLKVNGRIWIKVK
jgi:hypothetical protein